MMLSEQVQTPDGISWYTERFIPTSDTSKEESGAEWIVLIPAGEGDCHNLRAVASLLSDAGFQVLTFDTPGFSRTTAPPEAYARVTPQLLADQIVGLLDQLRISRATFFGCSSGGCATLGLCAFHPSRVKCGIVHEVPLDESEVLLNLQKLTDGEIVATCRQLYANGIIEQEINDGRKKWDALGEKYHARLDKNYVPWVRGYVNAVEVGGRELASVPESLQRRPVFWTVGSLNPGAESGQGIWKSNFDFATNAGLTVDNERLRSLHFPTVTIPEDLASWIQDCMSSVEE